MQTTLVRAHPRSNTRLGSWAAVGACCLVLVARTALYPVPHAAWLIGGATGLVLVASLAIVRPAEERARIARSAAVFALGGVAAVAALVAAGPRPSVPGAVGTVVAFGVLAAVAEEALFRGAVWQLLEGRGALVAASLSAITFAVVHVPAYGLAALPVDLGAGVLLSWQRWACGRWEVCAATHAVANIVAVIG